MIARLTRTVQPIIARLKIGVRPSSTAQSGAITSNSAQKMTNTINDRSICPTLSFNLGFVRTNSTMIEMAMTSGMN